MPGRYELYQFKQGEVLELKKKHPCGGTSWEVIRTGADICIKCQTCKRIMTMPRRQLEKAVKNIADGNDSKQKANS